MLARIEPRISSESPRGDRDGTRERFASKGESSPDFCHPGKSCVCDDSNSYRLAEVFLDFGAAAPVGPDLRATAVELGEETANGISPKAKSDPSGFGSSPTLSRLASAHRRRDQTLAHADTLSRGAKPRSPRLRARTRQPDRRSEIQPRQQRSPIAQSIPRRGHTDARAAVWNVSSALFGRTD